MNKSGNSKYLVFAAFAVVTVNFLWVPYYQTGGEPYRWTKAAVVREMRWKVFDEPITLETFAPSNLIWAATTFFQRFDFTDLQPGAEPNIVVGNVASVSRESSRMVHFSYDGKRVSFVPYVPLLLNHRGMPTVQTSNPSLR